MTNPPFEFSKVLNTPNTCHGFFGRKGGVSTGIYVSLNACLHKGDDDANIAKNRKLICQSMGINHMVTLRQVHKNDVLVVDADTQNGHQADAMVTKTPGRLLAIQTADCAPILLADHGAGVVAGIHAGWRSAVAGIVNNTIDAMQSLGAQKETIRAVIGPCIQQPSFEVGQEVFDQAKGPEFFMPSTRPAHYLFDLSGYVLNDLKSNGIETAIALPLDTYTLEEQYFSYRRSCHSNEPSCGGQLSVIGVRD